MTQRHYLGLSTGTVEISDRIARVGWELTEKAEEGAVGSSTIDIDDPDMDLVIEPLRPYTVIEDESEATDNVIYSGYIAGRTVARVQGVNRRPVQRAVSAATVDANSKWNTRVMVGTDCKRKAENDTTRMAWLLTTSEAGFIDDAASYVSAASPAAMDAVDYRGQYLNQVVDDGAQHTGKNWWLQRQETGTGRVNVAWYGKDSLSAYASPLYLSNDLADMSRAAVDDGTSLVWPLGATDKLDIDPSRLYTGVYLRYANGTKAIYRRNPDVNDAGSPLYHVYRDYVADYPNVKTKAKAIARATRLLADLAEPDERITAAVELPKGKATMLRAGMRVQVKATHLDGYTSWRWLRVLSCTVSPVASGERYKLTLELQGPGQAAGGPPPPPYTGSAITTLEQIAGTGADDTWINDPWFTTTGDAAPGGWPGCLTVGSMWTINSSGGHYRSITTSVAMRVRLEAHIGAYGIISGGTDTLTMSILVNGAAVATDSQTQTGTYFVADFYPDVIVDLAAGDTVSIALSGTPLSAGGFVNTAGTPEGSYLRVGRGTHMIGSTPWVGP